MRTLLPVMDCNVAHTVLRTCCSSETWASKVATLCARAATSELSLLSPKAEGDPVDDVPKGGEESVLLASFCWNWVAVVLVIEAVSGSGTVMADSDRVLGSAEFWGWLLLSDWLEGSVDSSPEETLEESNLAALVCCLVTLGCTRRLIWHNRSGLSFTKNLLENTSPCRESILWKP